MNSISKDFMTKTDVMEEYSISKNTIYRWFHRGLPYIQVGGTRLVNKKDLQDWFDSNRVVQSETIDH